MKNKFLSLILAVCLVVPCVFAFAGCGQSGKRVKLDGKSIVFDRVEDIQWDAHGLHILKMMS